MRTSQYILATLKETPSDAEILLIILGDADNAIFIETSLQ